MENNKLDNNKPVVLLILDGMGLGKNDESDAVYKANTPALDGLKQNYPYIKIKASGQDVGLPEGQMGNSEVGHLNIGAGRIVYQSYTLINKSIENGSFFNNEVLIKGIRQAKENLRAVHLAGLLSDGGVHSHINHFKALIEMCKSAGIDKVYIHAMLDGRDVPPRCAQKYIDEIETFMKHNNAGEIATVSGRYYGMDRDNRWDRTQLSYDTITQGKGIEVETATQALKTAYERKEDDEFVKPSVIIKNGKPVGVVNDKDTFIFVNFRPDRARQITWAMTLNDFDDFKRDKKPNVNYICMCRYDETLDLPVAFPPQNLKNILGSVLSENKIEQLRISETEKYAHVTFFFNGQAEEPMEYEKRILIPSPRVPTYDLKPEMSAFEIRDRLTNAIKNNAAKVYICNFANCDMVGHTGKFKAAVSAVETVDMCVHTVVKKVLKNLGFVLITADHGNAEEMLDEKGNTVTAHTTNPVPFISVSNDADKVTLRGEGRLADIAPTILDILGIEKPAEMDGQSLILK